jgi:hypothetical protein
MTLQEHEALIDRYERLMLEADNRPDRITHATEFLAAIRLRNDARTQQETEELERALGLR